jgi:transposase InsO family protein
MSPWRNGVGAENRDTASDQGVQSQRADLAVTVHSPRSMISGCGLPTRVPLLADHPHTDTGNTGERDRERFISTLRREGLDQLLITGQRHLAVVLQEYLEHYNICRPHGPLKQQPPAGPTPPPSSGPIRPLRRDRFGGLVHEHVQVA